MYQCLSKGFGFQHVLKCLAELRLMRTILSESINSEFAELFQQNPAIKNPLCRSRTQS